MGYMYIAPRRVKFDKMKTKNVTFEVMPAVYLPSRRVCKEKSASRFAREPTALEVVLFGQKTTRPAVYVVGQGNRRAFSAVQFFKVPGKIVE